MNSDTVHFYEPRLGYGLPHDPFNAIVGPRPIGWISSHDGADRSRADAGRRRAD